MNQTMLINQNSPQPQSGHTFSAKEKDDETGYSYFGARYYDSELSVWLSVDPMCDERPSLSPYNYCQWNPINRLDPDGMLDKESRIERRFERKYSRWQNRNQDELKTKRLDERYEMFRNSTNLFGKKRGDTKWFNSYESHTGKSPTTAWNVTTDVTREKHSTSISNDGSGSISLDQTVDIGVTEGQLQISYDMHTLPDRLQIFDAESGKKIFDTKRKVKGTGSQNVNFSLKENNTKIRIVINKGRSNGDQRTIFNYDINIEGYRPRQSGGKGGIINQRTN